MSRTYRRRNISSALGRYRILNWSFILTSWSEKRTFRREWNLWLNRPDLHVTLSRPIAQYSPPYPSVYYITTRLRWTNVLFCINSSEIWNICSICILPIISCSEKAANIRSIFFSLFYSTQNFNGPLCHQILSEKPEYLKPKFSKNPDIEISRVSPPIFIVILMINAYSIDFQWSVSIFHRPFVRYTNSWLICNSFNFSTVTVS
jgi:hypothetical protein